jgi:hypothetical protein
MKISVNDFLAQCELKGNYELANYITNSFIESMQMCNAHRKDMTGADWLSVMINDYDILFTEKDIQVVPK